MGQDNRGGQTDKETIDFQRLENSVDCWYFGIFHLIDILYSVCGKFHYDVHEARR